VILIRKIIIIVICLNIILFSTVQAQKLSDLATLENNICRLFRFMSVAASDKEKQLINSDIVTDFEQALEDPESFNYPFDSLKYIGKIKSSDQRLRIYTWNIPFQNGTHQYTGYLQLKNEMNKEPVVYKLTDQSDEIANPAEVILDNENWYGALYYDVILSRAKENRYYILLGFDFNDLFSSKKVIEILCFDDSGKPVFGKPVIETDGNLAARKIFEFSARVSMNLRYSKEKEMIIYDHLSPSRPSLAGKFQFYGPDMSYDGLKFEDGIWKVHKDIDIRNTVY
jgi:hypothetical protein